MNVPSVANATRGGEKRSTTQQLQRISIFCAGLLQGTSVEAFDGVDDLGSLPGKHQLWNDPLVSVINKPLPTHQVRICGGASGVRQYLVFRDHRNIGIVVLEPFVRVIWQVSRVEEIVTPRWRLSPMNEHRSQFIQRLVLLLPNLFQLCFQLRSVSSLFLKFLLRKCCLVPQ